GGGLKKAAWFFTGGPFVLMNADILTDLDLKTMISFHREHAPLATLALTDRVSSRYFLFNEEDRLCGWRNVKTGAERISFSSQAMQEKAFSGIHILSPEIFPLMQLQGKFSIVDVYLELAASYIIKGFDHSGSKLVDVGKPEAAAVAERLFD
ncbi:MAG: NDP-sugar synthase, partial [Chitinophagales bacterium]